MLVALLFGLLVVSIVFVEASTAPDIKDLLEQEASGEAFFAQLDAIDRELK
jgi:hypothetical protein